MNKASPSYRFAVGTADLNDNLQHMRVLPTQHNERNRTMSAYGIKSAKVNTIALVIEKVLVPPPHGNLA